MKEKEDEGHRQTTQHKEEEKAVKEKEDEGHRQTRQHTHSSARLPSFRRWI